MWNQTVLIDIFNPLIIYITLATLILTVCFQNWWSLQFNSFCKLHGQLSNCWWMKLYSKLFSFVSTLRSGLYSLFHVSIFLILCHAFGFSKTCISRWKSENTILSLEVSQQSLASMKNTIIIYLWSLFFSHLLFVRSNFIQNRIM